MIRRLIIVSFVLALFVGWTGTARAATDASSCGQLTDEQKKAIAANAAGLVYEPDITFPGFTAGSEITISPTTLADYIRSVFIVFVWIIGVLAVVMIIYGGVKWVSAAGNAGQINDAKDVVTNAIIGLIIGLTSVLLLNIVNPKLTAFEGLATKDVVQCLYEGSQPPGENNEGVLCTTSKSHTALHTESGCALYPNRNYYPSLTWPVKNSDHTVTSKFGPRQAVAGITMSTCHAGVDLRAKYGTPVLAVADGKVTKVGSYCGEISVTFTVPASGERIAFHSVYNHLSRLEYGSEAEEIAATYKAGDVIGYSGGNPQLSCKIPPHLHFELYTDEIHDPQPCLEGNSAPAGDTIP